MREKPLPGLFCFAEIDGVTCFEPAVIAAGSVDCNDCGTAVTWPPWYWCAEHADWAQDHVSFDCKSSDDAYHGIQYHQVVLGKFGPPLKWVLTLG